MPRYYRNNNYRRRRYGGYKRNYRKRSYSRKRVRFQNHYNPLKGFYTPAYLKKQASRAAANKGTFVSRLLNDVPAAAMSGISAGLATGNPIAGLAAAGSTLFDRMTNNGFLFFS